MTSVRKAAVAGLFYPENPAQLRRAIDHLLARQDPTSAGPPPRALIVPHAGYVYSGEVAARAYRLLSAARGRVRRVVVLGPAHRVWVEGMAIPSTGAFATPLGRIALDRAGMARIADLPGVAVTDEAHRFEHSLEVQLPFLQVVLGAFTLVPIAVGDAPPEHVAAVVDVLAEQPDTLFVLSSDLSHFLDYEHAREADSRTRDKILAHSTSLTRDEACGASVINGFMCSRAAAGLSVELLDLRNSGDSAGDRDRVVGYGSFALH
jgi:AmmeMemoRadiSam system protein B